MAVEKSSRRSCRRQIHRSSNRDMVEIVNSVFPARARAAIPLNQERMRLLRELVALARRRGVANWFDNFAFVVGPAADVEKVTGHQGAMAVMLPVASTIEMAKKCPEACFPCREFIGLLTSPHTPHGKVRVLSIVESRVVVHLVAKSTLEDVIEVFAEVAV